MVLLLCQTARNEIKKPSVSGVREVGGMGKRARYFVYLAIWLKKAAGDKGGGRSWGLPLRASFHGARANWA